MAAVSVVLPWSTWPIVPTFTCGLVRSNFFFAIVVLPSPWTSGRVPRPGSLALRRSGRIPSWRWRGPGTAAQVGHVAEHLGQRDQGAHDLGLCRRILHGLHPLDLAAAAVEVAHDVAHELLGHRDLDLHDRLEDGRVGLAEGVLDGHRAGDLERHLRRVDVVVRAVEQGDLDVDHRVAGEMPLSSASRMPWSTGLMYSRGIVPPTILSTNS